MRVNPENLVSGTVTITSKFRNLSARPTIEKGVLPENLVRIADTVVADTCALPKSENSAIGALGHASNLGFGIDMLSWTAELRLGIGRSFGNGQPPS